MITKTQNIAPIDKDPASPMKTLAGEKLNTANPNIVPDRTTAKRLNGIFPELKNKTPNIKEEIRETRTAKPSKPSIKLIALITTI